MSEQGWNAKLRDVESENASLRGAAQGLGELCDKYKAENAKLRELLRESLMDYKLYAKKYDLPPYFSDVNEHLDARMRELGIEVDE